MCRRGCHCLQFEDDGQIGCGGGRIFLMIRCLLISCALTQDKRWDPTLERNRSGEPQLIGEAIAAAMHNEFIVVSCEISNIE